VRALLLQRPVRADAVRRRAYFVDLLTSFANSAKLTRYEFEESVMPCTEDETVAAHADPTTHALEVSHALAFRTGLGASLFAPSHADINVGDVQAFARAAFAKDNVAFLGTGLTEDALGRLVQGAVSSLSGSASLPETPTKYFGGETRVAAGIRGVQTAFVGFGVAGAPSPALAALAAHLSPSPAVKWGAGTGALVGAVPAGAALAPVYLPYSDGTLFGVLVQGARGALVRDAASAAVAAMRAAAELSADDAKKAVAKARFAAAAAVDARAGYVATLGPRLLAQGKDASALDALAAFDGLDASAVASAAQSLLKAKPTFVVVGDVNELPYADEVGL
jgi:ubiquinol-cytochrome c reductase core subunit 2